MDHSLQTEERRLSLVVVTKEVAMNETFHAFLCGILIQAAASIPPAISVIDLIEKTGSS
jgi:hypothetical protein